MIAIYSSPDKQTLFSSYDGRCGYDMRTEKFVTVENAKLENVSTVFRHIGTSEKSVAGKAAGILNSSGVSFETIAHYAGVSARTLHRWIETDEK